jgi:rRNA-processing protein FCF1
MILDSCVIIDFLDSDYKILQLASKHLGPIYIPCQIINEIKRKNINNRIELLNIIKCQHYIEILNCNLTEKNLEDYFMLYSNKISFQDYICMLFSEKLNYICVTNDKKLRNLCLYNNINIIWGLQILINLNKNLVIKKEYAIEVFKKIQKASPNHYNNDLFLKFKKQLV